MSDRGCALAVVLERDAWIWCARSVETENGSFLAVGTNDGAVATYALTLERRHQICGDWLAQREGLNAVSLRHLVSDDLTKLSYDERVHSLAICEVPDALDRVGIV